MYQDYFRLTHMPFSIAPDPRFLYMSGRHREALAHLLYGVRGEGGIVLLTGEVGTGKTTLCRCLLEQIHARCDVAFILNPKMSVAELLAAVCDEFHVPRPPGTTSVKLLVDAINGHLLRAHAEGRPAVLIIDEAQNLRPDVLEQLRLLTNLETNTRKLLQIILIGQPELQMLLDRPEMRQVAQRIVARYHLGHLTRAEVAAYVAHRLRICGAQLPLFPAHLTGTLYRATQGVPRLINLVCDRALLGTYVQGKLRVTRSTLRRATREVFGAPRARPAWGRFGWLLLLVAFLAGGGALAAAYLVEPERLIDLPAQSLPTPRVALPPQAAALPAEPAAPPPDSAPAQAADTATLPALPPRPLQDLAWPEADVPRARSEALGFQALLKLHGVDYEPVGDAQPCKEAAAFGLRCLHGRGGLADLARYDQPALLLLDGSGTGGRHHAVLTALEPDAATFIMAGETRRVALADISPPWSGHYVLLWRAPAGFRHPLAAGSRGPAVVWLRAGLAKLRGDPVHGPEVFDRELVRQVKAFQAAEGMVPDGVAGPVTLMRLSARVDENQPRLSAPKG